MNIDIFIVSCAKHFDYLMYCMRSIAKFSTGFRAVRVMIPETDFNAMEPVRADYNHHPDAPELDVQLFKEWPGKGMMHHEYLIMTAPEYCPKAEHILHTDSDCIFTEPVTPGDYFVDWKPVLLVKSFDAAIQEQPNIINWKLAVERAIGASYATHETMQRHPAVHYAHVYREACKQIGYHTRMDPADYIRAQRDEFPQTFCEYNTLGAIAIHHFRHLYHIVDVTREERPKDKIRQAWSHRPPTDDDIKAYTDCGLI